jgi:3-isopropylmalate/(R)-2-methylmalate dehydratase small subunit
MDMEKVIEGKAILLGDNIDTDVIIPGEFLTLMDPRELAKHALQGLDPSFPQKVSKGDCVLIAGRNFGCGSSREQAPVALKYAGIKAIVAPTFARIFYRNALNIGLPILECDEISGKVKEGDKLRISIDTGEIKVVSSNVIFKARPIPEFMQEIIFDGGLVEHLKKKYA